jgi:hypothetical protein
MFFIERLWRSLKFELIYPGDFATGVDLFPALQRYFHFYDYQRPLPGVGLSNTGRSVPTPSQMKEVIFWMRAPPLQLPGFAAVITRMDKFGFTASGRLPYTRTACQGTGSAGTRPEHRRNAFFVQTIGSTSVVEASLIPLVLIPVNMARRASPVARRELAYDPEITQIE